MSVTIETDLKEVLAQINSKLDNIQGGVTQLKIGQTRLEGKLEILDEKLSGQIRTLDERLTGEIKTLDAKVDGISTRI